MSKKIEYRMSVIHTGKGAIPFGPLLTAKQFERAWKKLKKIKLLRGLDFAGLPRSNPAFFDNL